MTPEERNQWAVNAGMELLVDNIPVQQSRLDLVEATKPAGWKVLSIEQKDLRAEVVYYRFKENKVMQRAEYMEWAKKRALEYCDAGEVVNAFASMASDLNANKETAGHIGIELGAMLMLGGHLSTVKQMRDFIKGFN